MADEGVSRASTRSGARISVTSSPSIPFPAPAPPLPSTTVPGSSSSSGRSKRSAAQAAAASIYHGSTSNTSYQDASPTSSFDGEGNEDGVGGAPSLTNGDSDYDDTSSMLDGGKMGETDEYTMDEMEYSHTAKYKDELTDEDDLLAPIVTSKRKAASTPRGKAKKKKAPSKVKEENEEDGTTSIDYAGAGEATGQADASSAPARKPKRAAKSKAAKAVKDAVDGITNDETNDDDGIKSEGSDLTDLDAEESIPKPKKARKPRKPREPKPEPVYTIPEVNKLPNPGYQGRLGYACLNTVLRKRKPPVFCSRTCRIDTIKKNGMDYLMELGRQNILDLATLIQWNEENVSRLSLFTFSIPPSLFFLF